MGAGLVQLADSSPSGWLGSLTCMSYAFMQRSLKNRKLPKLPGASLLCLIILGSCWVFLSYLFPPPSLFMYGLVWNTVDRGYKVPPVPWEYETSFRDSIGSWLWLASSFTRKSDCSVVDGENGREDYSRLCAFTHETFPCKHSFTLLHSFLLSAAFGLNNVAFWILTFLIYLDSLKL